jgi:hypothetical protein
MQAAQETGGPHSKWAPSTRTFIISVTRFKSSAILKASVTITPSHVFVVTDSGALSSWTERLLGLCCNHAFERHCHVIHERKFLIIEADEKDMLITDPAMLTLKICLLNTVILFLHYYHP